MSTTSLSRITWRSMLRAVLAIARKDLITMTRYPLNLAFWVLQPLIWLAPVYFMGQTFATDGQNLGFAEFSGVSDYMSFILVGTVLSQYIANVFWGMGYSLKNEMDGGTLESNWMTPVPRLVFLVGRTLASLVMTSIASVIMLGIATWLFGFRVNGNVLAAVGVALPMLVALYGFGFAFAAIVLLMRDANTLIDVSNFVVGLLSGANFPVRVLPWWLLPMSLILPLTYGYDAVRGLLLGADTLLPIRVEVTILVIFMAVMLVVGYEIFRRVERRCRVEGTLSMH
jgi:ABC-2 type transport system permease protein